jgi:sugar phosphate isomerase/epimerase
MINRLAVNAVGGGLEETADFCRTQGIGVEVTDFAFPANLDGDMTASIIRHRKALVGIPLISCHGPFWELVASSPDPAIVEVVGRRHAAAMRAAREIGATLYIAHTNFNPLIRDASYLRNFPKRMLDFWLPVADKAVEHRMVICLENIWEPEPEIQAELISTANHPGLKASFDNGHALIFSSKPAEYWIETLGDNLAHCHLHDNSGELDEHNPVGEGIENWPELMTAAGRWSPQAILVMESDRLERNQLSLQRLRNLQP